MSWTPRPLPPRTVMEGRYARLEPFDPAIHAAGLHAAHAEDTEGDLWRFRDVGPFADEAAFRDFAGRTMTGDDPLFFAILDKATGEIGQQVSDIQAATQESVAAINEIRNAIEKLSDISSAIAAAIEEQGATTQEVARNVQHAAQGAQEVSSNVGNLQRGAAETGTASSQVLSAAQTLSRDSGRLKLEVNDFLNSVRIA